MDRPARRGKGLGMMTLEDVRYWLVERDGRLYWRVSPNRRIRVGSEAGHWNSLACSHVVGLNGIETTRGRVVWALHNGEWPASALRHSDGDKRNDRIENLRLAAPQHEGGKKCSTLLSICQARPESRIFQNGISHCEMADQGLDHAR